MKKRGLIVLLLSLATVLCANGVAESQRGQQFSWGDSEYGTSVDHTTYGWVTSLGKENADGTVTVSLMEVPGFQEKTYTTDISLSDELHTNRLTGVTKAKALTDKSSGLLQPGVFAEVHFDAQGKCINFELVEFHNALYMDSASYGGELTAKGGKPGSMVALGWILGKSKHNNTITIGDGNNLTKVFNETYTLSDDVKIYMVDNSYSDGIIALTRGLGAQYPIKGSWQLVKEGSFDDINITKTIDGDIYYNPERWTALCVFDSNYQSSWEDGSAKVKELYLYNNAVILGKADLNRPDGVQYDGTSWYPAASKLVEKNSFTYNGSAFPFATMEGRMYSIGDTYTNIYLFVGDDGRLTLLDQGNRCASYQYWLNLAKLGFDPRDVDTILLTHGHGDHYQALYENYLMIERAGNLANVIVNSYAAGTKIENSSKTTSYTVGATLKDMPVLSVVDEHPQWDTWLSTMGPGADVFIWRALGHSDDTACFVFKLKATKDDEYFKEGDTVSWVYHGGYGAVTGISRGANRLAIRAGMQYMGAVIAPWAKAQSDFVYALPQHANHYPFYEVYKASKIAHVPFMEAMTEGVEAISNVMEKRVDVMYYEGFDVTYRNKQDSIGDWLEASTGFRCDSSGAANFDTIQAHGPFKRAAGEYVIGVKAVNVVHGFDAFLNKTDLFAGQTNVYGDTLEHGFLIDKDAYVHDPDGWYVQLICNVQDEYDGGVRYDSNFYKGNYTAGADNKPLASAWLDGPVEFAIDPDNWVEILRTERFSSESEAIAYAKSLTNGTYSTPFELHSVAGGDLYAYADTGNYSLKSFGEGKPQVSSYKVNLTLASEILLGKDFASTFRAVK